MSAFRKFFLKHGPSHALSVSEGELATFELTASQAEAFFNTEFFEFRHRSRAGVVLHRAPQGYSFPTEVANCAIGGRRRSPAAFAGNAETHQESNG